jgi:low affinity Fe/Cu permease
MSRVLDRPAPASSETGGRRSSARPSQDGGESRREGHRANESRFRKAFDHFATRTAEASGSGRTFAAAVLVLIAWAATGPAFGFSDTWQLIINTGTTIVTFLMVFLIQHSENKHAAALQIKLDELIHATRRARDRFISIEDLDDEELAALKARLEREVAEKGEPAEQS